MGPECVRIVIGIYIQGNAVVIVLADDQSYPLMAAWSSKLEVAGRRLPRQLAEQSGTCFGWAWPTTRISIQYIKLTNDACQGQQ